MDILITGYIKLLSKSFFNKFGENVRIIICGEGVREDYGNPKVTPYKFNIYDEEFENIYKTFHFNSVIYISKELNGSKIISDEFSNLENNLFLCRKYNTTHFIYVEANYFERGSHQNSEESSQYILLKSCEKLCHNFIINNQMNITVIRIPYIYNLEGFLTPLSEWIKSGINSKKIVFPGYPEDKVDFLWDEDLGDLLSKLLDEHHIGLLEFNISGYNPMSYQELSQKISCELADINFEYQYERINVPQYVNSPFARKEFGWFPVGKLEQHLQEMISTYNNILLKKTKVHFKDKKRSKLWNIFSTGTELILFFLIVIILDKWISGNSLLDFLDIRLLFVIIMGTTRGLNAGIIAAIMACAGYIYSASGYLNWQIIFFNVQNWLPYATYFLLGSITGYASDKNQDMVRFLNEEQKVIEDKYVFLSELYMKAVENNSKFNSQIISYKDSYGRIYSVIKKLNSTLPDHIFYEAVNVLEDALENPYVAIYTVDERSDFARLNVCSKELNEVLQKSLKMSDYPDMMDVLKVDETWINTKALPNYPAYARSIIRDNKIVGLIFIMYATDKQMSLEYSNKFYIVSGLIKDSLIRAIERAELVEKNTMLPDTKILKREMFQQILGVKKQMKEKEFSEYVLLRLLNKDKKLSELSDIVSRQVRNNDILGQGEDGLIYLLLSQTNNKYISVIAERLNKNGIEYEVADI